MKIYRRIFTLFLALIFVFPVFPDSISAPLVMRVSAAAVQPPGAGTESDPYQISTQSHLEWMNTLPTTSGRYFKQTASFTVTSAFLLKNIVFAGTYDGNGFTVTVRNLNSSGGNIAYEVRGSAPRFGGIFGLVNGTIKNLNVHLDNLTATNIIEGNDLFSSDKLFRAGGIASEIAGGSNASATMENCGVTGSLTVTQVMRNVGTRLTNSSLTAQNAAGCLTGLVYNGGAVKNCYSGLSLTCTTGTANSESTDILFMTFVTTFYYEISAGGIAGWLMYGNGKIENCLLENTYIQVASATNSCNANTNSVAGGIVGLEQQSGSDFSVRNNVLRGTKVYANYNNGGKGSGTAGMVGGWIRSTNTAGIANNYSREGYSDITYGKNKSGYCYYSGGSSMMDIPNFSQIDYNSSNNPALEWSRNPISATLLPGKDAAGKDIWAGGIVKSDADNLDANAELAWRTTPPPDVHVGTLSSTEINIKLTPRNTGSPLSSPPDPVSLDANNIRYELSVTTQSKLATPQAALNAAKTEIVLTPPAGAAVYYSESATGAGVLAVENKIGVPNDFGASGQKDYWIYSRDATSAAREDSVKLKITLKKANLLLVENVNPAEAADEVSPETGKLATPDPALNDVDNTLRLKAPGDVAGVSVRWKKGADGSYETYSDPIDLTSLEVGEHPYYAQTIGGGDKYSNSNELALKVEVGTKPGSVSLIFGDHPHNRLSAPGAELNGDRDAITLTSSESGGTIQYRKEGNGSYVAGSSILLADLTEGVHVWYAKTVSTVTGEKDDSDEIVITVTINDAGSPEGNVSFNNKATRLPRPKKAELKENGTAIVLTPPEDVSDIKMQYKKDGDTAYSNYADKISLESLEPGVHKWYAKTVSDPPDARLNSDEIVITVTKAENITTRSLFVESGSINEFKPFTPGMLAMPDIVGYDTDSGFIQLKYQGAASGAALKYGKTIPPSQAYDPGSDGFAVDEGETTYYIQSVDNSGMYDNSDVRSLKAIWIIDNISLEQPNADTGSEGNIITYNYANGIHTIDYNNNVMMLSVGTPGGPTIIEAGSFVTLKAWMDPAKEPRPLLFMEELAVAGTSIKPDILPPVAGGIIDNVNGITITSPQGGAKIYYTVSYDGTAPDTPTTLSSLYEKSIKWDDIVDQFTGTTMWIKAIAVSPDGSGGYNEPSAVTEIRYGVSNKYPAPAPDIVIMEGATVLDGEYFNPGNTVSFTLPGIIDANEPYSIYYTVGGQSRPSANNGFLYDPAHPYTLPARNEVTIRAVIVRGGNYPDSFVLEKTIKIKTQHSLPLFSAENGARIPIGTALSLMPAPEDIPEAIRPSYYMKEGDPNKYTIENVRNNPGDYYGVLNIEQNSTLYDYDTFKYSDYTDGTYGYLPNIVYTVQIGDGVEGSQKTYTPPKPEIHYFINSGAGLIEDPSRPMEQSQTQTIRLQGNAGEDVTVKAMLAARYQAAYTDGEWTSRVFSFYPSVATPTASPKASADSIVTLPSGTAVWLSCATSGAKIFFSTAGWPVVDANTIPGEYILGSDTENYDNYRTTGIQVRGTAGGFFTIWAVAYMSGSTESETAQFTYQLPAPVQAVYATPVEGKVVKGTEVILSTTTAGATIFYEISHNSDSPDDPVPNESPVFDSKKPIVIDKRTKISAVALKDNIQSIITEYEYTLASQVEAPVPSIPSGSIVAKGTRVSFETTDGASIAYTKDGSDPADPTNKKRMYGSDIAIDAEEGKSVSISLYATKTDMTPSEVVSVSYTVSKSGEVMTANPPANSTVKPGDMVTLSTSVTNSTIYYTTDGSDPTTSSKKGSSVIIDGKYGDTFVIRAIAEASGTVTTPYTFSYTIIPRTPAPSATIPNGATILTGATVKLTAPEGNIYYTTDGNDPTPSGQMFTADQLMKLTGSTVLKAIAVADRKAPSEISEYIYTMAGQVAAPTASLSGGTIDLNSKIELSTTTAGATIYYTTNGVTPTADNLKDCFTYDAPITISRLVSIRMFAVKEGMNPSVTNTVTYTVAYPAEAEEEEQQEESQAQWGTDQLFLFDQFADSGEGPLYDDIVLRDSTTMAVLSSPLDALPGDALLLVTQERSPSNEDVDAVARALDLKLAALYNITILDQSGERIQPAAGTDVEIGVPIPAGYENTIVLICRINENGSVIAFPTRRSGDMVYAQVDHFSKYAVAVPALPAEKEPWLQTGQFLWLLVAGAAAAGVLVLITALVRKRKKAKALK